MLRRHDGGKLSAVAAMVCHASVPALVATVLAACGGDSTEPPPPPPPPVVVTLAKQTDNMDGEVNKPASLAPSVLVTNGSGAPVGGVTVTFTVTGASGSIVNPVQTTSASGIATSGPWTLGTKAGSQVVTASAEHAQAVSFTATARPGPASALAIAAGNNQSAVIWHQPPVAPAVAVADQFGNAVLASGTITFAVSSGGGTIATSSVALGSDGKAAAQWSLGRSPGPNGLSASLDESAFPPVSFSATGLAPSSPFNIDVRYIGSATAAQRTAVAEAVQRWRVIIDGDLPDVSLTVEAGACGAPELPAINEVIDDVLVFVQIVNIDGVGGVLGGGGPCAVRTVGGLPPLGYIQLDAADLATMDQGSLNDLMLHEMGHVLGFGTIWSESGLLIGACPDDPQPCTTDPQFTGAVARDGYSALGGQQPNVPVEATGGPGTANSHWRESVFFTEIMTGFLDLTGDPLTGMTIGSMKDLGYQVDYASAEPLGFTVNFSRGRVPRTTASYERKLTGPILVVDAAGHVTGSRQRR